MLPTDDICDCTRNGLVDVGIPGRFVQLVECLHCGAPVSFDSCSLPDSASEMEPPKDPRGEVCTVNCIMDSCDFSGTIEQLWMHALNNHLQHVVMHDNPWHPTMLPYGAEWFNDTKRFLMHCPFGIYVISLELSYNPPIIMISLEGLDGHWRDFEVLFQSGSRAWSGNVKARTFGGQINEVIFHEIDTFDGSISESLPLVYIKVNMDPVTGNPDQTDSEFADLP